MRQSKTEPELEEKQVPNSKTCLLLGRSLRGSHRHPHVAASPLSRGRSPEKHRGLRPHGGRASRDLRWRGPRGGLATAARGAPCLEALAGTEPRAVGPRGCSVGCSASSPSSIKWGLKPSLCLRRPHGTIINLLRVRITIYGGLSLCQTLCSVRQ